MNALPVEVELLERLVAEAREHDVGVGQKGVQKRHALLGFQVDAQEVLVQRGKVERRIVDVGFLHSEGRAVRPVLVARGRLDLVDGRPHLAEYSRARRRGDVSGEFDHFDSFQPSHKLIPLFSEARLSCRENCAPWTCQRPFQAGGRFSMNAEVPSCASSEFFACSFSSSIMRHPSDSEMKLLSMQS